MHKFLYFTLFICPIFFIVGVFSSLFISDIELMEIGSEGWLAIIALLLFNVLFIAAYMFYKKRIKENEQTEHQEQADPQQI